MCWTYSACRRTFSSFSSTTWRLNLTWYVFPHTGEKLEKHYFDQSNVFPLVVKNCNPTSRLIHATLLHSSVWHINYLSNYYQWTRAALFLSSFSCFILCSSDNNISSDTWLLAVQVSPFTWNVFSTFTVLYGFKLKSSFSTRSTGPFKTRNSFLFFEFCIDQNGSFKLVCRQVAWFDKHAFLHSEFRIGSFKF